MRKAEQNLSHKRLISVLEYNPDEGLFHWKCHIGKRIRAGQVAGAIDKHNGYIKIGLDGESHCAHRLAYFYITGEWPEVIDHINRIKSDNRWCNLRNGTQTDNCLNIERTIVVDIDGVKQSLLQWCKHYDVNHNTAISRINRGWSHKRALGVE